MTETALYLIPVMLSDTSPVDSVLPSHNAAIIKDIKYFVVENIRSARRFLKKIDHDIDIDSLTFTVLDEHTGVSEVESMLSPIEQGHPIGVLSEAGCPAVADPGADIVAAAQRHGYKVIPLVGPSSILLALMGSGFNGQSFAFMGYLPIEADKRAAVLRQMERRIAIEGQTQIFIETPYRNNKLIAELAANPALRHLLLCVASDITGQHQSIVTRPLHQWANATYDYSKLPTIFLLHNGTSRLQQQQKKHR